MDLNPFRLCSGLKFLGYFMVALVLGLIGVSYYAVVVLTFGPHLFKSFSSLLLVALFHLLLVLLSWSYLMAVIRDPGAVPPNWKVEKEDFVSAHSLGQADDSARPSSSEELDTAPAPPFCNRCRNEKPPRCHHCSVCERCVLKMDHHCIWVVNCVGARNYKFFLLFLRKDCPIKYFVALHFSGNDVGYSCAASWFHKFFSNKLIIIPAHQENWLSPFWPLIPSLDAVLNVAFVLSLLCFIVMHISLLLSNTTSVEVHEKEKGVPWKYDLGWKKNIEQVFGTRKVFWLFPLFSKEDLERVPALHGLDFPTRSGSDTNV